MILCYNPFGIQFHFSRELMISEILCSEFGDVVYRFLTRDHGVSYHTQTAQDIRHIEQTEILQDQIDIKKHILDSWPQLPPSTVIMECFVYEIIDWQHAIHNL